MVNFTDDAMHDVEYVVILRDIAGNTSSLKIRVKSSPPKVSPAVTPPNTTLFHYDKQNEFSNDKVKVIVPAVGNLYDDIYFHLFNPCCPSGKRAHFRKSTGYITGLHRSMITYRSLWIKPDDAYWSRISAAKAVIVNSDGICEPSVYEDGYVKSTARTFGDYYIKVDTVPPVIHPLNIRDGVNMAKMQRIALKIGDNMSGIKTLCRVKLMANGC